MVFKGFGLSRLLYHPLILVLAVAVLPATGYRLQAAGLNNKLEVPVEDDSSLLFDLAVFPYQIGDQIPTPERTLPEIVYSQLAISGHFNLVSAEEVAAALDEQIPLDTTCFEIDCLAEYGEKLQADYVAAIGAQQVREKYSIEIRIIDVLKQRMEALEIGEYNPEANQLETTISRIIAKVVEKLIQPMGMLSIETIPEQSRIDIDGQAVGIAPLELELPGGTSYQISAVRLGYNETQKMVYVEPKDTIQILLKLSLAPKKMKKSASVRLFACGGLPFNQSSSTIDSRITLDGGNSYGLALTVGEIWRLGFGAYTYTNYIHDISTEIWQQYGATEEPRTEARVYYSSFIHARGNDHVQVFIGAGLVALRQGIEVTLLQQSEKERKRTSQIEVGWLLEAGLEVQLYHNIFSQFEMIYAQNFSTTDTWKKPDEIVDPFWDEAFNAFRYFTVLRINVGYRF